MQFIRRSFLPSLVLPGVEQPPPHHAGGDERHGHREQVDRAEDRLAFDGAFQQPRPQKAHDHGAAEEDGGVQQQVLQRVLERLAAEQVQVVVEPDGGERLFAGGLGRGVDIGRGRLDVDGDEPVDEDADEDDADGEDLDAGDFESDGSPILHAGDVDGVDIDELDESEDDDESDEDDAESDEDESDDDDDDDENAEVLREY